MFIFVELTVVIDGVDEPDPNMSVVVRHQDDVEQFFTLGVKLPQASVDHLQSLSEGRWKQSPWKKFNSNTITPHRSVQIFNLDERKSGSRREGLVLVLDLVSQVFLHAFLLEHLLLPLGPKQDPGRDGHRHGVLWLWLKENRDLG